MKNFAIIMILFFMVYAPLFYVCSDQLKRFLDQRFVIYVVLVTVAGIYLPTIAMYFCTIALLFVGTVRGRVDAVCRYILLAAFVPEVQTAIGTVSHYFGVIDAAGVLAVAAYLIGKFDKKGAVGRPVRGWTTEDFLVLIMFLIMAIGTNGFGKFNDTLRAWVQQFSLIGMPYILFRSTLKSTAEYKAAIACFGAATVFLAVFAIYETHMTADAFAYITKHLTGNYWRNGTMRGGSLRASVTMGGPLALACFMTVGIFALACSRDFFRNTIGYYGSLIVATLGLLATQSRGSLVAVFASAVVLSLALRKWGVAAAAAVVAGAAWPTLKYLATVSPATAAFMNIGQPVQPGAYYDYRTQLLERGLQVAAHHPFTGMRMTQVLDALADMVQGQGIIDLVNVYLVILLISGLVGLLPFLGLTVASGVRGAVGFKRVKDPSLLRVRGFILAAFTVVLIQFSFMSFIDRIPMTFVLAVCGIRLLVQERQSLLSAATNPPAVSPSPSPAGRSAHAAGAGSAGGAAPDRAPARDAPWIPRLPMISS